MDKNKYKEYTKEEFLKVLKEDGILFVKTNLGNRCIIKKKDIADFIILETLNTDGKAEITFFMPGIRGPVITTYGWFLNKANSILREEIINRLISLQNGECEPNEVKIFDTDTFYSMIDNKEIANKIQNYNKLYKRYSIQ